MEAELQILFTLTLDGREYSRFIPDHFTFEENPSGNHWIGWVDQGPGLDAVENRKVLRLAGTEPRYPNRTASNSVTTIKNLAWLK